jgi:hypothetical protein
MFNFVNKSFYITLKINIAYPPQQTKPEKMLLSQKKNERLGSIGDQIDKLDVC